jgi:hypothetical protein
MLTILISLFISNDPKLVIELIDAIIPENQVTETMKSSKCYIVDPLESFRVVPALLILGGRGYILVGNCLLKIP